MIMKLNMTSIKAQILLLCSPKIQINTMLLVLSKVNKLSTHLHWYIIDTILASSIIKYTTESLDKQKLNINNSFRNNSDTDAFSSIKIDENYIDLSVNIDSNKTKNQQWGSSKSFKKT